MTSPSLINDALLQTEMINLQNFNVIDPLTNIKKQRVFIYSGTKDTVVV